MTTNPFIRLDPNDSSAHITQTLRELDTGLRESEIAYRHGRRYAQRVMTQSVKELALSPLTERRRMHADFHLQSASPGNLDHLQWVQSLSPSLADHEVEIAVRAAGLNFRDVLKGLDLYPLHPAEQRLFGD